MTTETMTVHEALCERKTLDDRIDAAINAIKACGYKKHSAINIDGVSVDAFSEQAKSAYQKACDLIRRADAIKAAIPKSNAATTVIVGDKVMTVAEAIYEQQHGLDAKRHLLRRLTDNYNIALDKIKRANEYDLEDRVQSYIRDTFGNKDKADPKAVEEARRVFIENNTMDLIDPLDVYYEIQKLKDEIDRFTVAFDSAIQTSNATTMITIEY